MIESKVRSLQYIRGFPEFHELFDILDKHGQGTFASVFAVKDKQQPDSSKIYALKMIIPTIDVRRIENEIRILRRLGGKHNIIQMHTAIRIRDHVFILMPFINFIPFSDYYLTADELEIKRYMRALLSALAHVHKYKIIHRDIKPTNFLLDQKSKQFYLVDFGLAHSEEFGDVDGRWERKFENSESFIDTNSVSNSRNLVENSDSLALKTKDINVENNPKSITRTKCISHDANTNINPSNLETPRFSLKRSCSKHEHNTSFKSLVPKASNQQVPTVIGQGACVCGFRVAVCRGCRHLPRAPAARRGGTLGFRPPEVMMRHIEQTTAVDVWAVGVIFLSFLSGRYPFIKVDDDLDVLHAFTHLIGYERMQVGARSIGRRILVDPKPPPMEASDSPAVWLKTRCMAIRRYEKKLAGLPPLLCGTSKSNTIGKLFTIPHNPELTIHDGVGLSTNVSTGGLTDDTSNNSANKNPIALCASHVFPHAAYDLLARLLEPSPHKRISAQDALRHPYFSNSCGKKYSNKSGKHSNNQYNSVYKDTTNINNYSGSPINFLPRAQFC